MSSDEEGGMKIHLNSDSDDFHSDHGAEQGKSSESDSDQEKKQRYRRREKSQSDSDQEKRRHYRRKEKKRERKERRRKEREERKHRRAEKDIIVDVHHQSRPPLRVPPYQRKFVQELFSGRSYFIRPGGIGIKVHFDGISIPEGFLGIITPKPNLASKNIIVKCCPYFLLMEDTKLNGFYVRFENKGQDNFHLNREAACVDLRLIKLGNFFVRHLCLYSPEQTRLLGVHPQYPPENTN